MGRHGGSVQGESIRYPVAPRDVPAVKAARRLHLTLAEFELKKDQLYGRGFPRPDPTTGMYDLVKIDQWMDARDLGGVSDTDAPEDASKILEQKFGWKNRG
jgi:hypothetical protein